MRQTPFLLIGFLCLLSLGGCKKYLNVPPEGQYTGPQVFTSEIAIQQAINGLYNNLATDSLYGESLSTTTVEMLGQQWYTQNTLWSDLAQYLNSTTTQPSFEEIWQSAYATILDANVVIQGIQGAVSGGVVNAAHGDEMMGEAMGIRAMLHFDMLRMFGPVMSTSAGNASIPYYRRPDGTVQPILSGTQALDSVLADLKEADSLLSADPIITAGPNVSAYGVAPDFYTGNRNERFNYYAVKALMARAYLWGGLTSPAHDSALAVLRAASQWFPWLPFGDITGNPVNPDRIFSTEVLFGVYNREMYTNYNAVFLSPTTTIQNTLCQEPSVLTTTFENNENDYRYLSTWEVGFLGDYYNYKYAPMPQNQTWGFIQPLIRKSELFYIVAETDPSPSVGMAYLDSVRYNRGLANLATSAVLCAEIQKEYQKEFIGEGQLFYYYKRKDVASLSSLYAGYVGTVAPVYQVPLPLSESSLR
jgi:hypothetical protein